MFENTVDAKSTVDIDNENAFTSFIIGTGRWFVDKQSGIYRNILIVSNSIGLTSDQELAEYKKAIDAEYELYKRTPVGQSIVGKLGETGVLPMLIATPLLAPANTLKAAGVTGAAIGATDSVSSVSTDPSIKNTAFHTLGGAVLGTAGHAIAKIGVIGYNSVVKPVVAAGIDSFNSLKFSQHLQEELVSIGKDIISKYISPLTHSIDYTKGKISSAITGALGEANMHYALEKVLVKHFKFVRQICKYDSVHGYDGLYIKMNAHNQIEKVVFAESKASSLPTVHGLSTNSEGVQQLSKKHIENVLKKLSEQDATQKIAEEISAFLKNDNNWNHVTRLVSKTNGSGWTQWYEAVGGINFDKVTLRAISDEFKLVQKYANTLTLKRRAAAGLLPGVAASAADAANDDEQNVEEIEITAPDIEQPSVPAADTANQPVPPPSAAPVQHPTPPIIRSAPAAPMIWRQVPPPAAPPQQQPTPAVPSTTQPVPNPVKQPAAQPAPKDQNFAPPKITIGKQESIPKPISVPVPTNIPASPPKPVPAPAPVIAPPKSTPAPSVTPFIKIIPDPAPVKIPYKPTPVPAPIVPPLKPAAAAPKPIAPVAPPRPAPVAPPPPAPTPRPAPAKAPAPPPPRPAPPPPRPAPAKAPAPPPRPPAKAPGPKKRG